MASATCNAIAKLKPMTHSKISLLNGISKIKPQHATVLQAASTAQDYFALQTQDDANRIFTEVAKAANKSRVLLASLAYEETGMGCFEDKVIKNGLACELIHDRYKDAKTCGLVKEDNFHGIRTYANPVGPVCAITPVTNPTSTAVRLKRIFALSFYATIISQNTTTFHLPSFM